MTLRALRLHGFTVYALLALSAAPLACGSSASPEATPDAATASSPFDDAGPSSSVPFEDDAAAPRPVDAAVDGACVPQPGPDVPDDNFTDSNCDGIDGDIQHAIFVAPTGSDTAAGSIETPVKTIGKAVTLAAAAGKDVYVCNATYAENVLLTSDTNVYGGYDCASNWQRILDQPTIAAPKGVPLTIKGVNASLTIDRVALTAPDGIDPSESSIGAFVESSPNVLLKHLIITAGGGADGATPAAPSGTNAAATAGANGQSLATATCYHLASTNPASCDLGGTGGAPSNVWSCESHGGGGGAGGDAESGLSAKPGDAAPAGAAPGVPGANGVGGAVGAPATVGIGTVDAAGYHASNGGGTGTAGRAGGGGGGGAGGDSQYYGGGTGTPEWFYTGGGGGAGGNGGCGGNPSSGSGGGGASIGLLLFGNAIQIVNSEITTAQAGNGGDGVQGADGLPGGAGGQGGTGTQVAFAGAGNGSPGAPGGRGGSGGAGGPGGGGPSIGILAVGAPTPAIDTVTVNVGAGGTGGAALSGPDGADGIAEDVWMLNAGGADAGAVDAGADAH